MKLSRLAGIGIVLASLILAQEQPPAQGNPGGGGTTGNTPGGVPGGNIPGTPGGIPGRQPTNQPFPTDQRQQFPEMQRPIYLSGKVVMADGTPPPDSVTIERVCNGIARPEGYTDSKGRFSFQLGQNTAMMPDASVNSSASDPGFGGGDPRFGGSRTQGPLGQSGMSQRDLMGCELRATLAGYRSEVVNLSGRRVMDNPDVGTIILRPIAGVQGFAYSATSMMAPKDAKKSYEKARENAKKKKYPEAQKEYEKAVELYPKYAMAWYELGNVHLAQKADAKAMEAFSKALEADNKLVSPYLQMAQLYARENKWQEVADTSDRVTRLDPVSYPQAYFFNAVANYNLQKFDAAEKSAREAVKLDGNHRLPKAQHLLGIILAMKDDNAGAVENMKGYLQFSPQASDADAVRKQIAELEKRLGKTEAAAQ